jgi:hypothetical protein
VYAESLHLRDEGGAFQTEAGCGAVGAADAAAGVLQGLFDLPAGERRKG